MKRENFVHLVKSILRRDTWRPFTVELASGSRIEVNHPESITVGEELVAIKSTAKVYNYFEIAAVVRVIDATGVG